MRLDGTRGEINLDKKDRKIIEMLAKDGRVPLTQIAKKSMLSKDSIAYRIKRLQERGVIKKFCTIVNYKSFGYTAYNVLLQTREVTTETEEKFLKYLDKEPRIIDVIDYSDIIDFQIKILVKDIEEFDSIISWIKREFAEIIEHIITLHVVEEMSNRILPLEMGDAKIESKSGGVAKLDEKDIKIIKLLNENCRLSSYDIAPKIGINADTVIYRIKKMVSSGVIKFTTVVNLSALGYSGNALMLKLRTLDEKKEQEIEDHIKSNANLLTAEKTIGEWDLVLHFVTKDARDFHSIIKKIRMEFGASILVYDTLMVYREYEFDYGSFLSEDETGKAAKGMKK
ncbi:MAG: Lrp/AsnC family transcriptional regulator [archaeon]